MSRSFARYLAVRLAVALPVLVLSSCGGSNVGAVITVPNSVVVSDINGDGLLDIAVASAQIDETGLTQKPGLLLTYSNTKATPGTFGAGVSYPASPAPPSGLAVGDLTGTGSHDFVVSNFNAGTVTVFLETSPTSGTYGAGKTITIGGQPNDVQIADINGDGVPDLVIADNMGKVTYLVQNPSSRGSFGTPVSLPITNRGIAVAVGDLNGDGLADMAVTSFDANGDNGLVTIYFQDPAHPGTFISTPMSITTYGEPSQIRIADLNQDGALDLVIACQGLGSLGDPTAAVGTQGAGEIQFGAMVILQNSGAPGTFSAPVVYPGAAGDISLAVGDLDNDGLPDIALVSLYPQGSGAISTLLQVAGVPGTFASLNNLSGSGQPVSIAIGDMNGDGFNDIITADGIGAIWYANSPTALGTFIVQPALGQ